MLIYIHNKLKGGDKMNMKIARMKAGFTQKDVADKLNVVIQTVSRWETGEVPIPVEKLKELSKMYNVTTDFLLEMGGK